MPSSDIYKVKDPPWAKKAETPRKSRRRRRRTESFDDAVNKDVSKTHRRRGKNSGFRRLRHLMKKPDFSKKFWTISLSAGAVLLLLLVIWDWFFRYPGEEPEPVDPAYEVEVQ